MTECSLVLVLVISLTLGTGMIIAKLFFVSPVGTSTALSADNVDQALDNLDTVLGTPNTLVDHFILALPNQSFDENELDEAEIEAFTSHVQESYLPIWRRLSALRTTGRIGRLGVSEFSKQQLEILKATALANGAVAPELNQVNLHDCCVLPKDLIEYAKAEGIELLTHGDATGMCTSIVACATGLDARCGGKLTMALVRHHRHLAQAYACITIATSFAYRFSLVIGTDLCSQVLCVAFGSRLDHSERVKLTCPAQGCAVGRKSRLIRVPLLSELVRYIVDAVEA